MKKRKERILEKNITGISRSGPNPDFLIVVREQSSTNALMRLRYRIECDSCNVKRIIQKYVLYQRKNLIKNTSTYGNCFAVVGLYTLNGITRSSPPYPLPLKRSRLTSSAALLQDQGTCSVHVSRSGSCLL